VADKPGDDDICPYMPGMKSGSASSPEICHWDIVWGCGIVLGMMMRLKADNDDGKKN